jgi:parallel beta-helix repeat protein
MLIGTSIFAAAPVEALSAPVGDGTSVYVAYSIYKDGSGYTCAKNSATGAIDFRDTNSRNVIQKAIDKLSGGCILIKAGTYSITQTIYTNSVSIIGEGNSTVLDATTSCTGSVIRASNNYWTMDNRYMTARPNGITVGNMQIDGNRAVRTNGLLEGVGFISALNSRMVRIYVHDLIGGNALYMSNSQYCSISDCQIYNIGDSTAAHYGSGIAFGKASGIAVASSNIDIDNVLISKVSMSSVDLKPANNVVITNCVFREAMTWNGHATLVINMAPASGYAANDHITITGNNVYGAFGEFILLTPSSNSVVSNNIITYTAGSVWAIYSTGSHDNRITGNIIKTVSRDAIISVDCSSILVEGNTISDTTSSKSDYGVRFYTSSGSSLYNVIRSNQVSGFNYAIVANGQSDHTTVSYNTITNCNAGILLSGSSNSNLSNQDSTLKAPVNPPVNPPVSTISDAPASLIIFQDGTQTCAKDGTTGVIEYRGSASSVIQSAIDNAKGKILLSPGTYDLTTDMNIKKSTTICGTSSASTKLTSSNIAIIAITASNVRISDLSLYGCCELLIRNSEAKEITNITCERLESYLGIRTDASFIVASSYGSIISNVLFRDCKASSSTYGFVNTAFGTPGQIRSITYENCQAIDCGRYSRINDWVVGFDMRELGQVYGARYINCYASGNWESGFHVELAGLKGDIKLTGCVAVENGRKTSPLYGAGFMIGQGVSAFNCTSENNKKSGFYICNKGGETLVDSCKAKESVVGFVVLSGSGNNILRNCYANNARFGYKFVDCASGQTSAVDIHATDCVEGISSGNFRNLNINGAQIVGRQVGAVNNILMGYAGAPNYNCVLTNIVIISTDPTVTAGVTLGGQDISFSGSVNVNAPKAINVDSGKNIKVVGVSISAGKTSQVGIYNNIGSNVIVDQAKLMNTKGYVTSYGIQGRSPTYFINVCNAITSEGWSKGNLNTRDLVA